MIECIMPSEIVHKLVGKVMLMRASELSGWAKSAFLHFKLPEGLIYLEVPFVGKESQALLLLT